MEYLEWWEVILFLNAHRDFGTFHPVFKARMLCRFDTLISPDALGNNLLRARIMENAKFDKFFMKDQHTHGHRKLNDNIVRREVRNGVNSLTRWWDFHWGRYGPMKPPKRRSDFGFAVFCHHIRGIPLLGHIEAEYPKCALDHATELLTQPVYAGSDDSDEM
eukprot:7374736-Prymnesium_polylepis.1